jgi:hypothetical protein
LFGATGVWAIGSFFAASASRDWPSVNGVVDAVGVNEDVTRSSRGRQIVTYSAVVVAKYTVQGKEYTCRRIAFGHEDSYQFLARDLASQYYVGQVVEVYYAPNNPENSVLRREVLFGAHLDAIMGVCGGLFGLRLLLLAFAPTRASANSRWLPWSRRFTWLDLPIALFGAVSFVLMVPKLLGL